jgi:flagellar biosynthesis/type III secretory pathway protein FliH
MPRRFAYPYLAEQVERMYRPRNGWCANPNCPACQEARSQIKAELQEAPDKLERQDQAYEAGYQNAREELYAEAMRAAQMAQQQAQLARRQAEASQGQWYQRGYDEGYEEGMRHAPAQNGMVSRAQIIDEMLNECHVIAESNPNMAPKPFANAVRHRIKKLRNK